MVKRGLLCLSIADFTVLGLSLLLSACSRPKLEKTEVLFGISSQGTELLKGAPGISPQSLDSKSLSFLAVNVHGPSMPSIICAYELGKRDGSKSTGPCQFSRHGDDELQVSLRVPTGVDRLIQVLMILSDRAQVDRLDEVSPEEVESQQMLFAYAAATVPKITMIMRKAYGGAYLAMCSSDLGADMVFAWPTAEIAVMGADGAVNVLFRKELQDAEDPKKRAAEIAEEYRNEFASPYQAAANAMITDVIEPSQTRAAIALALRNTLSKRETRPPKKHGNIPL